MPNVLLRTAKGEEEEREKWMLLLLSDRIFLLLRTGTEIECGTLNCCFSCCFYRVATK
jgi:hypothetical protein